MTELFVDLAIGLMVVASLSAFAFAARMRAGEKQ